MDIIGWNKETRQAYVGTLIYSLIGVLVSILTPFAAISGFVKTAAKLSGDNIGGSGGLGVLLALLEICIIVGYIMFYLAVKDLKNITDGEERNAFNKIKTSIILDIVAAFFAILHLGLFGRLVCGILGIVSCIMLLGAYSSLKSSKALSNLSPSAVSGFSLLFTAEVLILVAIFLGWIPIIKIIGSILKSIAWILVLFGWRKVAKPVPVSDEEECDEKLDFNAIKEVFSESFAEAKDIAKKITE